MNVVLIETRNDPMGGELGWNLIITLALTARRGMGSIKMQT